MDSKAPASSISNKLLTESIFLYSAIYFFTFFKFLTGFFVARFLGPSLFGLRNLFGIVVEYASFSHLGTFDAMRKEVPYFRGKKDQANADLIIDNVFTLNMCYALVVLVLSIFIAIYLDRLEYDTVYIDFTLFIGFYTIAEKIRNYGTSRLTVDKKAFILSRIIILEGLSYAIACINFTYFWGLRGLFIGLLSSIALVDIFIFAYIKQFPRLRISFDLTVNLLRIGVPIMSITLMFIVLRSVDRIIIASFLPNEQLGFFAVGTIVSGLVYFSIADVARVVFAPRIMERLGITGEKQYIFNYLLEPTILIAYLTPLIVGTLVIAIHIPIIYFIPDYQPAIRVVQILCLGAFFISIAILSNVVIIAVSKQLVLVVFMLATVCLNAFLSYLFIILEMGITGVAVGTCISYAILSAVSLWYAMHQFELSASLFAKNLIVVYAPFLYLLGLLIFFDIFVNFKPSGFWEDLLQTVLSLAVFYSLFGISFLFIRTHPAFAKLLSSISTLRFDRVRQKGSH